MPVTVFYFSTTRLYTHQAMLRTKHGDEMQILFWKFSSSKLTVNRHMSVYLSEENLGGHLMRIWCWSEVVFFDATC